MFYTGEHLKCTGCGIAHPLPLQDLFVYTEGDLDLSSANLNQSTAFHPVLRRRAWCVDCDKPVLAERLPSPKEFANAIGLLKADGKDFAVDDELLELRLEEVRFLCEKLSNRKAEPKCLLCGSKKLTGFDVVDGKIVPEILHESCWDSPFEWHGFVGGYVPRQGTTIVRAYSFEGELRAEGKL